MTLQPVRITTAALIVSFLCCSLFTQAQAVQCTIEDLNIECSQADNASHIIQWNDANIAALQSCMDGDCADVSVTSDYDFGKYDIACGTAGSLTVVYTVAGCGESMDITAIVSVDDTTQPTISCQPNDTEIACTSDSEMMASANAWNDDNISLLQACSSDECSANVVITSDFDASALSCDGNLTASYTVTDDCGNTTTTSATFATTDGGTDDGGTDDGGTDDGGTDDGGTDDGGTDDGGTGDGGTDDGGNTGGGSGCGAVGGVFITLQTDTTEVTVCVGDDISDAVYAKVWEEEGDGSVYAITDADGIILSLTNDTKFQFEGTPVGTNFIYHVSTVGDVTGLSVGSNISDISGCHELSNAIRVNKVDDGDQCGCAMIVSLGKPTAICEGEEITLNAEVFNSNVCTIVCEVENSGTLVEWDMDACHSITDGVSNKDFSELAPSYPSDDSCVEVTATPVNVEGGMHSCTIPKDGLGGRAMCFSGSKKCYWKDDSEDALKFSVTLTPEQSSTITGLQFYESAPDRFRWYNPDFSEDIDEGPNNHPRYYGLRVTRNGEEIFQQHDIPTTQDWTLEEFDFSGNEGFRTEETATFEFELLGYCPAWNNAITYAWDLDNIKLLGGCCDKDTTITAIDYIWSTGDTGESITVSPTETTEYSVTVTDCMGCVAHHTVPVLVKTPVTADLGDDITVCREDLPLTLSHSTDGIDSKHPRVEWSTGETGESIQVSEAGTYTVTVTDGLACSDTDEIVVSIADPAELNLPDNIDPLCNGSTMDLSTLEPAGQSGGTWTSADGEVVTSVGAGTYTYTYTDGDGCDASGQVTLTDDNFSFTVDDQGPICADDTFDFGTIVPSGIDGDNWSVDDLGDGNYRFNGTNANGCTASDEFSIAVDNFSIDIEDPALLCPGEMYMLSNNEPADYPGGTWTDSDGNVADKAAPGMFTYTVMNDNGCTASDQITFTESGFMMMQIEDDSVCWGDSLLLSDLEFPGQSGGFWKDLNNEVVTYGLQDTRYRYHYFDEEGGCTGIVDVKIHEKHCEDQDPCAGFSISISSPSAICNDETYDLASSVPAEIAGGSWTDADGNVVTSVGPGTYTYSLTTDAGCTASAEITIPEADCPDPCAGFSIGLTSPDAICNDATYDLASSVPAEVAGGAWTDADGNVVTSVGPGTYTYSVTTDAGCSASADITIPGQDCTEPCESAIYVLDGSSLDQEVCEDEFPFLTILNLVCNETVQFTNSSAEFELRGDTVRFLTPGSGVITLTDINGNQVAQFDINVTTKDCSDPATPCDDGNPNTENDIQIDECNCCGTPIAGQVIYVDGDAAGANDGTSWTDAYTDLQDAMGTAQNGQEIWLADGTYIPAQDGNRDAYFLIPSGVDLYGGFNGSESNICQRNFEGTRSVLSGDLNGDDKSHQVTNIPLELVFENSEENSHYVLRNSQVDDDIKIDGIAITGGIADVTGTAGGGGFLFVNDTDATLEMTNVLVLHNQGAGLGGAGRINTRGANTFTVKMDRVVYLQNSVEGPELSKGGGFYVAGFNGGTIDLEVTNCIFAQNYSQDRGGAVNEDENVSSTYTNSLFIGNKAKDGGAFFDNSGNETFHTNNTFYVNFADETGGAMVNFAATTLESRNCIFFGNATGVTGGPGFDNFGNSSRNFSFQNCMFSEADLAIIETEAVGTDDRGGNQFGADPLFVDPLGADFSLASGSPAIDAGDDAFNSLADDLVGRARIQGAAIDLGAQESGDQNTCNFDKFDIDVISYAPSVEEVMQFIKEATTETELVQEETEVETIAEAEVVTYPNPTSDFVNVIVTKMNPKDEVSMKLFDIAGNALPTNYRVVNDFGNQVEYTVPVKDFRGGVYIVKTKVGRITINKRVIVIK